VTAREGRPSRWSPGPQAVTPDTTAPPDASKVGWLQRYIRRLVVLDLVLLLAAGLVGVAVRFGTTAGQSVRGLSYASLSLLLAPAWLACLALSRCYESRFLGSGSEEFRRVSNASLRLGAVVVTTAYVSKTGIARGFLAVVLPLGLVALLLGRLGARVALHRARRRGECTHRVVVVGTARTAQALVNQLQGEPMAGLGVVAACVSGRERSLRGGLGADIPVVGGLEDVLEALVRVQADTVAVAASPGMDGEALLRMSYALEGTGVDLLVAPALTDVTGTRVSIRPIAGLPLLHVDEPELEGARKLVKTAFDLGVALVGLVLLSPMLLGVAAAVRLSTPGPALFRQTRVGRGGELFRMWKFRSMYADAEQRRAELAHRNESNGGILFKVRDDPRITPLGRRLRAYSLDELPQLVNVLRGQMSLAGPRPPLPTEVERYEGHTHRRLLIKPGITRLWQVSGRSDLSWDDTVGLDLQYVESWSLGLDLAVLAKTVLTVVRRSGAY